MVATKEKVAIIGIEHPYTIEILEVFARLSIPVAAGILTGEPLWELKTIQNILQHDEVSELLAKRQIAISGSFPKDRYAIHGTAIRMGFSRFCTIVDPSANVASTASIGKGVFINTSAVVGGLAEVEDFATLNRNSALGHHSIMEEFSVLGPGAIVTASCRICRGANIGASATLIPNITIGEGSVVGAGSVVTRDVAPGVVVAGNPARKLRDARPWSVAANGKEQASTTNR